MDAEKKSAPIKISTFFTLYKNAVRDFHINNNEPTVFVRDRLNKYFNRQSNKWN